jgi:cytochrome c2
VTHPSAPRPLVRLAFVAAATLFGACARADLPPAPSVAGGDPARGRDTIVQYNCGGCHTIPGIPDADGVVGPPLTGIADRKFIAGEIANEPENLVRWILDPTRIEAGTMMPDMGVSDAGARDAAAYLYTLRDPALGRPPRLFRLPALGP